MFVTPANRLGGLGCRRQRLLKHDAYMRPADAPAFGCDVLKRADLSPIVPPRRPGPSSRPRSFFVDAQRTLGNFGLHMDFSPGAGS
jgi:hypothetical protein